MITNPAPLKTAPALWKNEIAEYLSVAADGNPKAATLSFYTGIAYFITATLFIPSFLRIPNTSTARAVFILLGV